VNTTTRSEPALSTRSLHDVAELLNCPWCGGSVTVENEAITCIGCKRVYPVQQGIALLARTDTPGEPPGPLPAPSSRGYQQQYQQLNDAQRYNENYSKQRWKRNSTAREHQILHQLLSSQRRCDTLLDIPSGGGRLSPALEEHTDLLIEADIGFGQVLYGATNSTLRKPAVRMTASAFHIPLRNGAVDASVCCRLCHHLPTAEERERLVVELLRVSRRFVVMTFFDHDSFKNRLRRARRRFDHKPPKLTMSLDQVRELGRRNGAELVACPALFALFSGHRFALLVKRGA